MNIQMPITVNPVLKRISEPAVIVMRFVQMKKQDYLISNTGVKIAITRIQEYATSVKIFFITLNTVYDS